MKELNDDDIAFGSWPRERIEYILFCAALSLRSFAAQLFDQLLIPSADYCNNEDHMILMGFRYLASSIPIVCLTGVAIGVGLIFAFLVFSVSRNPSASNSLVRWSFIGFSLVEVSGFIGLVYSFLLLYALSFFRLESITTGTISLM